MDINTRYTAIHRNVLIVARLRTDGWKAYVVPVPGRNHDKEAEALWQHEGSQLSEAKARPFFPQFSHIPYAK
jgi:hypothetical protein